jgi:hypothetical protein
MTTLRDHPIAAPICNSATSGLQPHLAVNAWLPQAAKDGTAGVSDPRVARMRRVGSKILDRNLAR